MRNLKKFLALVLAFMMTMSLMVTVNASNVEKFADKDEVTPAFQEAIEVLTGMGVIRGSEGKINAQGEVTRAEMAAFIYRVYTGDVDRDQEFLYADTGTQFTDVESGAWYSGVIGFCSSHAFILGRGDGTFDPNAGVTGYEALVMILRALGYGQDNEFSGGEWQQTVHTRAINIGLFQNINASSYSYSLPKKATREFVAELLFQGIQKPMVTYNRGYVNHYEFINSGTGVANQTIGQWQFGLTAHTGILLGNESTGEQATKIGFAVDPVFSYNGPASAADRLINGTINDDVSKYVNVGTVASPVAGYSAYLYSNANDTIANLQNNGANVTLSFVDNTVYDVIAKETVVDDTAETGLDLFNHKVKVWYDNRSTATESVMASTTPGTTDGDLGVVNFPTNLTTYSIIDKATLAKTVVVDPSAVSAGNTTALANRDTALNSWTKGGANPQNLGEAAYNAGFNVREANTDWAYWNYAFSPLQTTDYAANVDGSSASNVSPIHKNDSATTYQLYQVISNSADKSVDVVISLDLSINEIAEENRYQLPNSFAVWNSNAQDSANAGSYNYFGVGLTAGSPGTTYKSITTVSGGDHDSHTYLNVPVAHLVNTDSKSLSKYDPVAVVAIFGTANNVNPTLATVQANTTFNHTNGNADTLTDRTGTYEKYDFSDNHTYYQITKLEKTQVGTVKFISPAQSVTIELGDGSQVTLDKSIFAEATDGHFAGNDQRGVNQVQRNERYKFYLDDEGKYLFYTKDNKDPRHFVYGTYLDWNTEFVSSAFAYGLSFVEPNGDTNSFRGIKTIDGDTVGSDALPYYEVTLPKREDTTNYWNSTTIPGQYSGFLFNEETGALTSVTDTLDRGTYFFQADANNFGADKIEIGSTDVTVGAKIIGNAGYELALTNDTQFYFVDGAGTANLKVTPAKLSDLKGRTINVTTSTDYLNPSAARYLKDETDIGLNDTSNALYEMVYFKISENNDYAQIVAGGAKPVETVFIPLACLSRETAAGGAMELVFVGDMNRSVGVKNSNTDGALKATSFRMFDASTGNEITRWVRGYWDGSDSTTNTDAWHVFENDSNVFYKLEKSSDKANDGEPIYDLAKISNDELARIVGQYWDEDVGAVDYTNNNAGLYYNSNPNYGRLLPAYFGSETYGYIANDSWTMSDGTSANVHLVKVDEAKVVNEWSERYQVLSNAHDLLWTASIDTNMGMPGVSYYLKSTSTGSSVVGVAYVNGPLWQA